MSRAATGRVRRQPPKINAPTLAKPGSEPLAELLAAAARADAALERTLALEMTSEADALPRRTSEAKALVKVSVSVDPVELAQPIYAVLLTDSHGVADGVLTRVGLVLHDEGRGALLEADLASPVAGSLDASALRLLRLTGLLGDLADAEGDADRYIAAQARRAPPLRDHVGSAQRLFEAGRTVEALDLLRAAQVGAAASGAPATKLRIDLLDALGRRDESQAERWRHFRTDLSVAALRQQSRPEMGSSELQIADAGGGLSRRVPRLLQPPAPM